jgi:Xaa-Pro aminopeptidase
MNEHLRRRKALWEKVRDQRLDAFLLVNVEGSEQPNVRYLTGFTGSFSILVVTEESLFFTDPRYTEQAQNQVDLPVVEVRGRWVPQVIEHLKKSGLKRIGIGSARTTIQLFEDLKRAGEGLEFVPVGSPVEELRRVKSEAEIQKIKEAVELTEAGLKWILKRIRPGMTEREVALKLEFWYRKEGAEDVAFELIVAAGPQSAMPHHRPSDQPLQTGEVVLFDIGARVDGYCADITRVVALGEPKKEVKDVYKFSFGRKRCGNKCYQSWQFREGRGRSGQKSPRGSRPWGAIWPRPWPRSRTGSTRGTAAFPLPLRITSSPEMWSQSNQACIFPENSGSASRIWWW